ncbi:hypothetical protein ACEXQD_06575 [Herbiconiux sp. P15]|uniref:hypothetical protein n=1 Tax=Herbiconiux liukaitaii TaxID=3342799 RepID=UPI0035BB8F37
MTDEIISMDSVIDPEEHHWMRGANNLFAEGVVAEYLYYLDLEETSDLKKDEPRWLGGNKPLIDVTGAGLRVDAKVAFREKVHLSEGRLVEAVGFMGANREIQARDGVTHYGLVEVDMPGRFRRRGSKYVYIAVGTARLFMVPAADINAKFVRKWRQDGTQGSGANLYLPVDEIAQYEQDLNWM